MYKTISIIVIIAVITIAGYIFLKPREDSDKEQPDNSDKGDAKDTSILPPVIPQLGEVFGI